MIGNHVQFPLPLYHTNAQTPSMYSCSRCYVVYITEYVRYEWPKHRTAGAIDHGTVNDEIVSVMLTNRPRLLPGLALPTESGYVEMTAPRGMRSVHCRVASGLATFARADARSMGTALAPRGARCRCTQVPCHEVPRMRTTVYAGKRRLIDLVRLRQLETRTGCCSIFVIASAERRAGYGPLTARQAGCAVRSGSSVHVASMRSKYRCNHAAVILHPSECRNTIGASSTLRLPLLPL